MSFFDFLCSVENEETLRINCVLRTILLGLLVLTILINIFGFVRMILVFKKVRFENMVLLSTIIQSVNFIFAMSYSTEFVLQLNEFLKIFIIAYITKKFLRLHSMYAEQNFEKVTKKYQYFLLVFILVDFTLSTVILVFNFIDHNHKDKEYYDEVSIIKMVHEVIALILSGVLFWVSLDVKKNLLNTSRLRRSFYEKAFSDSNNDQPMNYESLLINTTGNCCSVGASSNESLKRKSSNTSRENHVHDHESPFHDRNFDEESEEFYNLKKKQLNLIVFPLIIANIYQTFYSVYRYFYTEPSIFYMPLNELDAVLDFLNVLCDVLSGFTYYLAFYYIIRLNFKPKKKETKIRQSENYIDEEKIRSSSIRQASKSIEKYFEDD